MIKIVQGDLLMALEDIVGHQVNCQGKMNSGVAKQVREKYPETYTKYMELVNSHSETEEDRKSLLGEVQGVSVNGGTQIIANIFGQFNYGYDNTVYTDTEALFKAFKTLRTNAERHGYSVALPYGIGCYRGGADWKEVEDLLLIAFAGYEVKLYKMHKG